MKQRTIRLLAVTAAVAIACGLTPAASARPLERGHDRDCVVRSQEVDRGTRIRDDVRSRGGDDLSRQLARDPGLRAAARRATWTVVTVPVAFHVIRADATAEGGNVTNAQVRRQIRVLNDSFSRRTGGAWTGFRFELVQTTRTTSKQWFKLRGYGKEKAMKTALKVGGLETLNIYSADLGDSYLGWAYLAEDAAAVGVYDGVVVHFQSLPGGGFGEYSEGDTGTHEVGHWLNLLHTFDGGCASPGDHVADTAPEASPAFECEVGRDTCAGGGLDPITNFMDYTVDTCMFEFTRGQAARMRAAWTAYRAA